MGSNLKGIEVEKPERRKKIRANDFLANSVNLRSFVWSDPLNCWYRKPRWHLQNWEHNEQLRKFRVRGENLVEFPPLVDDYCIIQYYSQRFYDALIQANLFNPKLKNKF